MIEQPSWMPSDPVIKSAVLETWERLSVRGPVSTSFERIYSLIATAVERALAEQVGLLEAAIASAVKKALAEQWKLYMEDRDAIVQANIRVQNLYTRERNEQEARHKREVIAARLIELRNWIACEDDAALFAHIDALDTELAALDKGDNNG